MLFALLVVLVALAMVDRTADAVWHALHPQSMQRRRG